MTVYNEFYFQLYNKWIYSLIETTSLTFSRVFLISKNDSFVLYTWLVEMHFWLVNPDHVLAI